MIDLKELDLVFDTILELNKNHPEKWRDQIVGQLTKQDGINEFRDLAKMKAIIANFIEENKVSCAEATVEDRVYENAPKLVEDLAKLVGYHKYDDK